MPQSKAQESSWPPANYAVQQNIPEFLSRRVDKFYCERVAQEWQGKHILHGRTPSKDAIILSTNDYLSISNHSKIVNAQIETLLSCGNGMMMSAVFLDDDSPQRQFERRFAKFLGAEAIYVTQSGWCANTGLIQSIADANTPVYIDMYAHMSLWEGIQSAGAQPKVFRHNDPNHLERQIKRYGAGVIAVDSVYSTSGSICPLVDVVAIAEKYDCVLIVDESHSLGTHGQYGEGLVASLGLSDRVQFRTSSLSKAICGRGGMIACSERHREYLVFESRPMIFSTAVLPHDTAGFSAAIDVIKQERWRRTRLHRNADYLRDRLSEMGYNVSASESQIISLEAGPEPSVIKLRDALEARGVFGAVFCAPATPKNRALIRLSITAALTQQQLEHIVDACYQIRDEVKMHEWASTRRLRKRSDSNVVSIKNRIL